MNTITSKFDKVLNASPDYGHVNHEPDSSTEQQCNTPQKSMPFSDQIGNYQRNKGIPTKSYADSKIYIVGSGIAGMSAAYYFIRDGHVPAKILFSLNNCILTAVLWMVPVMQKTVILYVADGKWI